MSCDGIMATNPMCLVAQAATGTAGAASTVVDGAFSNIAGYFGQAAQNATTWLWQQIGEATTLDLQSPALAREMTITGAIAATLCLGLFVIQVTTAALRGHPVGLGRALSGLLISFVGSALALATTRVLLGAVDALSDGVVRFTMDTQMDALGSKLSFVGLAQMQNPAVVILLALVIIVAAVVVWAAMMIRKLMLIVAAVLAPLAFAGATADFTRAWVRRWIELVVAMIVSKLLLVIILSIGVAVLNGAGQSDSGAGQAVTQLAGGSLILLLGGLAPWVAIRMFHFAGDTLHSAHATARQASVGAQTLVSAPQKVTALQAQGRALASVGSSGSGRGSKSGSGMPPPPPRPGASGPAGPPSPGPGAGLPGGSMGPAGAASGGGAAAAASVAAPAAALAGVALGGKSLITKAGNIAANPPGQPVGTAPASSSPIQESPMKHPPTYSSRS
ncbi:type IV secretion system protein [Terrabacter carboxydivorans]|uniref:TrbL/VirB6 plasmid conjugal transfer protein n=1 Tax=Terrabacter carboxydivorans TaxID=619730 RepID=A0ABN3MI52_9MICO